MQTNIHQYDEADVKIQTNLKIIYVPLFPPASPLSQQFVYPFFSSEVIYYNFWNVSHSFHFLFQFCFVSIKITLDSNAEMSNIKAQWVTKILQR